MKHLSFFLLSLLLPFLFLSCDPIADEDELTDGIAVYNDEDGIEFFAEWTVGDNTITESKSIEWLYINIYHEDDLKDDGSFEETVDYGLAQYKQYITKNMKDGLYTIKIESDWDTSERTDFTVFLQGSSSSKEAVTKTNYFEAGDTYLELKAFKVKKEGNKYTIYN